MVVEKVIGSSSSVEVIYRILNKSIVIDAWIKINTLGMINGGGVL